MDRSAALAVFESLSSGVRLDVYRLLVRNAPNGLVAGDIAAQLDVPASNLSFHFKGLVQAGLVTVEQEGRFQRYRASIPQMQALIAYLTEACCAGQPETCGGWHAAAAPFSAHVTSARYSDACAALVSNPPTERPPMHILFLCTGNSCRSILAEATFNHLAARMDLAGWRAMSAGSHPTGEVHPRALALLAQEGIATEGLHSKSWDDVPSTPDLVITVCDNAAGETCPAYLGQAMRVHWGVADPASATGSEEDINAAFMRTYSILRSRIEAFLALPVQELAQDRTHLKAVLAKIAQDVV